MIRYSFLLCLFLSLQIKAQNRSFMELEVNNKRIEYDVVKDGKKGLYLHLDMNVNGMSGKKARAIVFVEDENKNKIKDSNGKNRRVRKEFTPRYDNSHYNDFKVFVPYSLYNGNNYYLKFRIKDVDSDEYLTNYAYFHITKVPAKSDTRTVRTTDTGGGSKVAYKDILRKYAKYDNIQISGKIIKSSKQGETDFPIYKFYYDSGWEKQVNIYPCSYCHGTGVCDNCKFKFQRTTTTCFQCNGSKVCIFCGGEKKTAYISAFHKNGNWIDHKGLLHTGGSPSPSNINVNPDYHDSDNDQHGPTVRERSKCMTCLGSGKCSSSSGADQYYCHGNRQCQYCFGKGYVSNTYSSGNIVCTACNGTGICHYCHGLGTCSSCGGSGKK